MKTKPIISAVICIILFSFYLHGCGDSQLLTASDLKPMEVAWKKEAGVVGKTITYKDLVILNTTLASGNQAVVCFDSKTGEKRWSFQGANSDIDMYGNMIVAIDEFNNLVFLNPRSGSVDRKVALHDNLAPQSRITKPGGVSYNITGFAISGSVVVFINDGGVIEALDLENNGLLWKFELPVMDLVTTSLPIITNGLVIYAGTNLYALDLSDGKLVWVNKISYPNGGVIHKNNVIVWNRDAVSCVNLNKGRTVWRTTLHEWLVQDFGVSADMLFVFSQNKKDKTLSVYGLTLDTGKLVWQEKVKENTLSGNPLCYEGVVYFIASSGYMYAVSGMDGKGLGSYKTGDITFVGKSISPGSGLIYSGGGRDLLFAFKPVKL